MPGVPNGTGVPVEEEQHGEHHGLELQRTGRCVGQDLNTFWEPDILKPEIIYIAGGELPTVPMRRNCFINIELTTFNE